MSNPFALSANDLPKSLFADENQSLFTGIMRGVEKESLRVATDAQLAMSTHPVALGAALTHPQITTDFSEALLEFITPPSHRIDTLLEHLDNLHLFTYQNLPKDEILWNHSMPCLLPDPETIPVARYGSTNRARMKTVYRVGLGHRYGRTMQTVAGVHFNFSLPKAFWAFMHQQENSPDELEAFITRRYFDLIRNFRRHYWLLIYLFGASPAISRCFTNGREHDLSTFEHDPKTLYKPYATSLRMGDLGYQSHAQEQLYVCYNSLASYVRTLGAAISRPYPTYERFGIKDPSGDYLQLNSSLLQIENEFYSAIRPKRTAQKGETALTALCRRGVEYIEVRCLDLDPFTETGVSAEQLHFLDVFLVYCALQNSPDCDQKEFIRIQENQKRVVNEGRRPGLELCSHSGDNISITTWGVDLLKALQPVAQLLDHSHSTHSYSEALELQLAKIQNPDLTPSANVLSQLETTQCGFIDWAKQRSTALQEAFLNKSLSEAEEKKLADMAEESSVLRQTEENQPQIPFDDYLKAYYKQYQACCANVDCL